MMVLDAATKPFERQVRDALAEVYGMRAQVIMGRSRVGAVVEARKLGYYVLRNWGTGWSWHRIGHVFSRDHNTVLNGCRAIAAQLRHDPALLRRLDRVLLILQVPSSVCPGFTAAFVDGRAVDYALPADRSPADLCATPGCLSPRCMHGLAARPSLEVAA